MSGLKHPIRYRVEAAFTWSLLGILRLFPLAVASAFGGWTARTFGPCFRAHGLMLENLRRILPELTDAERQQIASDCWDNVGRLATEFPFLATQTMSKRMDIIGLENLDPIRESRKSTLFVSGHLGNWELAPKTATDQGIPLTLIYRPANNPWVEGMIQNVRGKLFNALHPKNAGARALVASIKQGNSLGMLVDQKMNDGIEAPFFGHPAMTSSAMGQLMLGFDLPCIMARVIRHKPARFGAGPRFTIEILPPFTAQPTGNRQADILAVTTRINAQLEAWIREYPGQWFWMHQRWGKFQTA